MINFSYFLLLFALFYTQNKFDIKMQIKSSKNACNKKKKKKTLQKLFFDDKNFVITKQKLQQQTTTEM